MTSIAMTPSRPHFGTSFSGSIARPDFGSTEAISMAEQLPNINFGFDELRERMALFTARFDDFIERGRKRVLEERNHFRLNVAEVQEAQRARKREIEHVNNRKSQHEHSIAKEVLEQEEINEAIQELKMRGADHLAKRDELKSQVKEVQDAITKRRNAQLQHQRALDDQARHNGPELRFWETSLCLRIGGTGVDDRLRFIYTHIYEKDWNREYSFELSMERTEYEVLDTQPVLDRELVQAVVERLNETRELAPFLKAMRGLFSEAANL